MHLSTTTARRLVKTIMVTAAVAALAVPLAQGKSAPAGKDGPLDGWALGMIHDSTPSFITDHSAGQNVPPDPWAHNIVQGISPSVTLITEHSPSQNGATHRSAAPITALTRNGFAWSDAGVGAALAFALVLLAGAAMLAVRRRHLLA